MLCLDFGSTYSFPSRNVSSLLCFGILASFVRLGKSKIPLGLELLAESDKSLVEGSVEYLLAKILLRNVLVPLAV